MQLNLALLDIHRPPSASVWEQLEEEQRVAALEVLARLIAQAALAEATGEENNDER